MPKHRRNRLLRKISRYFKDLDLRKRGLLKIIQGERYTRESKDWKYWYDENGEEYAYRNGKMESTIEWP